MLSHKIENKPDTGKDIQMEVTSNNQDNLEKVTRLITSKLENMEWYPGS